MTDLGRSKLGVAGGGEPEPLSQRRLSDARDRVVSPLIARERRAESIVGGAFVVAALLLIALAPDSRSVDPMLALGSTALLALYACVVFEVGSFCAHPIEIAFVPMLFVLPPEWVPALVAVALMVGKLVEVRTSNLALPRILLAPADAWFAIGPALILLIAGSPDVGDASWYLFPLILAAQFAFEFAITRVRELLHGHSTLAEQLIEGRWIYTVDALLFPLGMLVAFAASDRAWTLALAASLPILMMIFARERTARLDSLLELGSAYRGTALVLGDMIGHDDAYTALHSHGVVSLSLAVADDLGIPESRRRHVEFGALLHDVGKVAIAKEVINKPGPLNAREWTVIKTHTIEGQRILEKIGGLMSAIGGVVRSSHERWDGAGYPDGLAGEQIPLEARIISACDAFHAMTTDRPYRKAMTVEAAIAELEVNAGTQFDAQVVEVLVARIRTDYGLEA